MSDVLSHRKATRKIRFVDGSGKEIVNTAIGAKLVNHKFLFGCGAFDFLPATSEVDMGSIDFFHDKDFPQKQFFEDRVNKWTKVFNYGTIPFYWGGFEPKEGEVLTDSRMRAAKLLKENNARVKGHPLCWHTACADWLMEYDNATILQKKLGDNGKARIIAVVNSVPGEEIPLEYWVIRVCIPIRKCPGE